MLKTGAWTKEEDAILLTAIKEALTSGLKLQPKIRDLAGTLHRTPASVRGRYDTLTRASKLENASAEGLSSQRKEAIEKVRTEIVSAGSKPKSNRGRKPKVKESSEIVADKSSTKKSKSTKEKSKQPSKTELLKSLRAANELIALLEQQVSIQTNSLSQLKKENDMLKVNFRKVKSAYNKKKNQVELLKEELFGKSETVKLRMEANGNLVHI